MLKLVLALMFIASIVSAKPIKGLHDYGVFLSNKQFDTKCFIKDNGLSGTDYINVYNRNEISCEQLQQLFNSSYIKIKKFFAKNGISNSRKTIKKINIRILTQAELNNPNNFADTEYGCMDVIGYKCVNGIYMGRTFFHKKSGLINVYIVFNDNFYATFRHEIIHTMLYMNDGYLLMPDNKQHKLINNFIKSSLEAHNE